MEKHVLISVSPYIQKYYINELYSDLPKDIKEALRAKLGVVAEKTNAIISVGFYENGEIFIEQRYEDLSYVDEIGTELRIKKFQQEEEALLQAISKWYLIYHTANGEIIRTIALMQAQNKSASEIIEAVVSQFGEAYRSFAVGMLAD